MLGEGTITIQNTSWRVSIAADPRDLTQGLGGIASLPDGAGEFFDLGQSQIIQVTTVPMLLALDIAFLDEDLTVTEVYRDIQPGYLVTSTQPARYFLEVNAGELAEVNPGVQAEIEVTAQPVITSTGGANWTEFIVMGISLVVLAALLGTWLSLNQSGSQDNRPGSQLLAANRKKAPDVEVEIVDWGANHKLVKIYRHGRVYAATYAEPWPTLESARADYLADPRSFLPFDESIGKYLADTCQKGIPVSSALPRTRDRSDKPPQSPGKLDYLPDSPEFLAYTIEDIGYREKIDTAFLQAIRRARRG